MRTDMEQIPLRKGVLGLILILVLGAALNAQAALEGSKKANADRPAELHTGTRSGRVVDAVTGKPIEGAIVVYIWDLACFSIEGGTVPGTTYETTTDKNGAYSIPDQTVIRKPGTLCSIAPEQVIVYKFGYIWYEVVEDRVKSFVTVLPQLRKKYRQQGNLVQLEPWIDQMYHAEHLRLIGGLLYKPGPLMKEAVKEEEALIEPEQNMPGEIYRRRSQDKMRELRESKALLNEGKMSQADYAAQMREALRSPYRNVRSFAADELKAIGDVESIGILFDILRSKVYSLGFKTALSKLNDRIGRWDVEDTLIVPERLRLIEEMERWWERNKDLSEVERLAVVLISGRTERGKSKVAEMLFKVVDASAVPYLQRFLESKVQTASLQQYVLLIVSKLGDKRLVPQVRQKLLSPDVYV
ncbi:MAG: carboxypeptidase-like regulatory domain-containing protein, partial [Planctomycetota bacterium]